MARPKADRYEPDPLDSLRREIVGEWSEEKHARLRRYVDITSATRRKFNHSGSTYIDLYCGTGRARIRGTERTVDGSAVVAAAEAAKSCQFSQVHIADIDGVNVEACTKRLAGMGVTSFPYVGAATDTVKEIVPRLHSSGLHLSFLDPYSIGALPFCVIERLASMKRMDLLIHVSVMDLSRNAKAFMLDGTLDGFAPGWHATIKGGERNASIVFSVFNHWRALLESLGYKVSDNVERVTGGKNQLLYWLVLASKHDLAGKFWNDIRTVGPQSEMSF